MQHRMINKFTVSLVFSLLTSITVSAAAAGSANPWALPPSPEKPQNFQRPPQHAEHRYQENQTNIQYPGFRFVTPEILESLKQQQMQTQQVPGSYNYQNRQYRQPQSTPPQLMSGPPVPGYYGFQSPGMGFANPLYDTPAVSPWGNGTDMLYRGGSFPGVPDAAIGGIPPMNVSPFTGNNENGQAESAGEQYQNKVFNPFTFGSNGNL